LPLGWLASGDGEVGELREEYQDLYGARAASSASDCGVTVSQPCSGVSGQAVQMLRWVAVVLGV
jgi:hypothetical protein